MAGLPRSLVLSQECCPLEMVRRKTGAAASCSHRLLHPAKSAARPPFLATCARRLPPLHVAAGERPATASEGDSGDWDLSSKPLQYKCGRIPGGTLPAAQRVAPRPAFHQLLLLLLLLLRAWLPVRRRVMLKVSGEALEGAHGFGIEPAVLQAVAKEVAAASLQGVQVAIVVGGGNFFRGVDRWDGLDRATADYVGCAAAPVAA